MVRSLFNQVRVLLPFLLAVVMIVAVACGSAEQPTQAPVVAATEAPAMEATKAPEPAPVIDATIRPTNTPVPTATPSAVATPVPSQQEKFGNHVNMRAYADTKDWDPLGSSSLSSVISYSQLYNQVVQFDTVDTDKIVCDLCSSWEVTNGGNTFTFKLHDNIKWQDGKDLTAEDVVYSLARYYNPEVSPGRSGLSRNYVLPVSEGGLKAIDRDTVEFNLQFPSGSFIKFLAVDYVKILPKHLLEQGIDLNQAENIIKHKSGSGPFVLDEYQRGNFHKVTKNPDYFKEGRPFFGSIDHFIITGAARFISALKAKQVEMGNAGTSQLSPKQNAELEKDMKGEVVAHFLSPGFNVGLMLNVKKKPFDDHRVRRAIYLAVDRQQLNDIVLDGTGGVTSIFMPGMAYTEEEAIKWPGVRPKDTPGGQEDLAEAGFADGFETTYDVRKVSTGIPQIKPTFLDIAPAGIPPNIMPHSKGVKCGLIHSNSPLSLGNHCTAKPKIPKPLVYAQVSPLGTSFATP